MPPVLREHPTTRYVDLQALLPEKPLYGTPQDDRTTARDVGWLLSPEPFLLTTEQVDQLQAIGPALHRFAQAIDQLYKTAGQNPDYAWVQALFDAGKPPHLLQFSRMNRFRSHLPRVIRPDLLVTDDGFRLSEIDAVPGGIGFTALLQQTYHRLGWPLVGKPDIPKAFLDTLLHAYPKRDETPEPFIAIIVSDEAADYRAELSWLAGQIQAVYPAIAIIHPKSVLLRESQLGYRNEAGHFQAIDIVYRFFELFDLPNIPQIELIQYAVKKGLLFCTPPFKPHQEEKLVLGLLHHPFLRPFWESALSEPTFALLKQLVPETWILNPEAVQPQAAIVPELRFQGKWFRTFAGLGNLTQKQRELVIKPSGFSPLAWGSRGVKIGHDLSREAWEQSLQQALTAFETTPHILQRFANPHVHPYRYFDSLSGTIRESQGRTRLCPYYFIQADQPELIGVLATTCPKDKKIIHGMRDGVMRPAAPA